MAHIIHATTTDKLFRQAQHLHRCGPRPILEALIAVEKGNSLKSVLADFERLPPETYHATLYFYGALSDEGDAQ
jgi:hypothetical protein